MRVLVMRLFCQKGRVKIVNIFKLCFVFIFILFVHTSLQIKTYPHIAIRGLFTVLKVDDIGFAHVLLHAKWIENAYQYGEGRAPCKENQWKEVPGKDPVVNLIRVLWFRHEESHQLLPTKKGSLLSIGVDNVGKVFGKLIQHVYNDFDQHTQKELVHMVSSTDALEGLESVLLPLIEKAYAYCKAGERYPKRMVEAILWAFFFHKVDMLISQEEKIIAIHDCIEQIDPVFKREPFCDQELCELYESKKFESFEKSFQELDVDLQVKKLETEYDLALHVLINMCKGAFPPVVQQGNYGYEYTNGYISERKPADCYEAAMHDLFSILWYNPETKTYDDSFFKHTNGQGFKKLREALAYVYLADCKGIKAEAYTKDNTFTSLEKLKSLILKDEMKQVCIADIPVHYINRSVIKQVFMNLVSDIPGIAYVCEVEKKGFELVSNVKNFTKLCNYFYGITVDTIADLGDKEKGIFSKKRIITFQRSSQSDASNRITVTVRDRSNGAFFDMAVHVGKKHVVLSVPDREKAACQILKKGAAKKLFKRAVNFSGDQQSQKIISIFILLSSMSLMEPILQMPLCSKSGTFSFAELLQKQFADKTVIWNELLLCLVYNVFSMKNPEVKQVVIQDLLERRPDYYERFKGMIHNLIEYILRGDDQNVKSEVGKIILRSGFYKKDPVLKRFVQKAIVDNSRFYDDQVRVKNMLHVLLNQGYKDLVLAIVKHPRFDIRYVGDILSIVIKQGHVAIASHILSHPSFCDWAQAVRCAIQNGWKEVALAIVTNDSFDASYVGDMLDVVLKKEWLDVALGIAKNSTYNASCAGTALRLALKKDCRTVALCIVKNPTFDPVYMGDVLSMALKKGYADVALHITANQNFDDWAEAVRFAIEQKWENVASTVVNNLRFYASEKRMKKALVLALETGCEHVALDVVNHGTFDARKPWVSKVLMQEKRLLHQKPGRKHNIMKVIVRIKGLMPKQSQK